MQDRAGFEKTFSKVHEKDLRELVTKYKESDYAYWTKHDVKVILKQFYKWQNKGIYPPSVAWICTTIPAKQKFHVRDRELLTEEEVFKVVEATTHPRNKALIAVLVESGTKVGEIGNFTIGQVKIDASVRPMVTGLLADVAARVYSKGKKGSFESYSVRAAKAVFYSGCA